MLNDEHHKTAIFICDAINFLGRHIQVDAAAN